MGCGSSKATAPSPESQQVQDVKSGNTSSPDPKAASSPKAASNSNAGTGAAAPTNRKAEREQLKREQAARQAFEEEQRQARQAARAGAARTSISDSGASLSDDEMLANSSASSVDDDVAAQAAASASEEDLVALVKAGDLSKVKQHARLHPAAVDTPVDGQVPLVVAVTYGSRGSTHETIARWLIIRAHANPAAKSTDLDQNALHAAALQNNVHLARALVQAGSAPVQAANGSGMTALHFAAMAGATEAVRYLVGESVAASVAAQDDNGETPLHAAARGGHVSIIKHLLRAGADPLQTDKVGYTALHTAAAAGKLEALQTLVSRGPAPLDSVPGIGLDQVAKPEVAAWLQSQGPAAGNGSAIGDKQADRKAAAKARRQKAAERAAKAKQARAAAAEQDRVVSDDSDDGAGDSAMSDDERSVATSVSDSESDSEAGDLPSAREGLLLSLAESGSVREVRKYVRAHPEDVNVREAETGFTPLHKAAAELMNGAKDRSHVIKWLVLHGGADTSAPDADGDTVLHFAAASGSVSFARWLIFKAGARVDARNEAGETPLLSAAGSEQRGVVQLLIRAGADVQAKDGNACTALHLAARSGDQQLVRPLLNARAFVRAQDDEGATPLHYAVGTGNMALIKLLVARGKAPLDVTDNNGMTPLDAAKLMDLEEVAKFLESM